MSPHDPVGNENARPPNVPIIPPELRAPPRAAEEVAFGYHDVIGDDDRRPVANVRIMPYRAICALRITAPNGTVLLGSGFLINPVTVVTAGHCVYIQREGGWMSSIEVIPALDGAERPFASIVSQRFRCVSGWVQAMDPGHDYGAILLPRPFAGIGAFDVQALDDASLAGADVTVGGYPADRGGDHQYIHDRKVSRVDAMNLYYTVDTFPGQSGSPIWGTHALGEAVSVGIHTTGGEAMNSGTRVTADVMANLEQWMR